MLILLAALILLCFPALCVLETVPFEGQQSNMLHDALHALFEDNGLGAASKSRYWFYGITRSNGRSGFDGDTSHVTFVHKNIIE